MAGAKGRSGGNRTPLTLDATNTPPPTKPKGLSAAASKYWDELAAELAGFLRLIDGHELKILAVLLAQADHLTEAMKNNPNDAKTTRLYLQVIASIHRMSASFGLNPSDRQRLKMDDVLPEDDPFLAFLQQKSECRQVHRGSI